MARLLTVVPNLDGGDELAIRALFFAARELPLEACRELARRLTEHVFVYQVEAERDLTPQADQDRRCLAALRVVAQLLGRAPLTTEYMSVYERRRAQGDHGFPAVSTIVKRFDGWANALASAGLVPAVDDAVTRRRRNRPRKVGRYGGRRLVECLQACARDLGHSPSVRAYTVWREGKLGGGPGRRAPGASIPHYRTYQAHYGGWPHALRAAGLAATAEERADEQAFDAV